MCETYHFRARQPTSHDSRRLAKGPHCFWKLVLPQRTKWHGEREAPAKAAVLQRRRKEPFAWLWRMACRGGGRQPESGNWGTITKVTSLDYRLRLCYLLKATFIGHAEGYLAKLLLTRSPAPVRLMIFKNRERGGMTPLLECSSVQNK